MIVSTLPVKAVVNCVSERGAGPVSTWPLGNPPGNKIFLRSPTDLEFFGKDAKNNGADTPKVEPAPAGKLVGSLDLLTREGTEAIKGTWRRNPETRWRPRGACSRAAATCRPPR